MTNKLFTEVESDIMDVIEFRKLWLKLAGWKLVSEFKEVGRTYFDLIMKRKNEKIGIVAVEDDDVLKNLRKLSTYLKYVNEVEFLTNSENMFWKIHKKFARKKGWRVTILDGSRNSFNFVYMK